MWGTAASGSLMLLGLGLSAAGLGDVTIDSPALADSFITGLLGQFVLGEALVNPEVGQGGGGGLGLLVLWCVGGGAWGGEQVCFITCTQCVRQ